MSTSRMSVAAFARGAASATGSDTSGNEALPGAAYQQAGVPSTIPVASESLSCMLRDAARGFPDRVALDFLGATTTYSQLEIRVARAVEALRDLGIRRGDAVGIILPDCPQHVVVVYAVWCIGAIVAEHNPLTPAAQLRRQLHIYYGRVITAQEKTLERFVTAVGSLEAVDLGGLSAYPMDLSRYLPLRSRLALRLSVVTARTQCRKPRGRIPTGVRSRDDLAAPAIPLAMGFPLPSVSEAAALLYTGGTTGTLKAVYLTHENLRSNVEMSLTWAPGTTSAGKETFYVVLFLFHVFGMSPSLSCVVGLAATQVVLPKFGADLVLAAWKRCPAIFFPGVSVTFDRLATRARATGANLSSYKIAVCGVAPNPLAVTQAWEGATGGIIIEGYGITESSPVILGNPVSPARRPGALGVSYLSTQVRLADPEDAECEVAPGEVGELLARGPQVFSGYWDNPEESAEVLLDGGWLRTGGLVRQETGGFYIIVDRRKEFIISGGFNIHPMEAEAAVRSMPQVEEAAVVGLPAEVGNESVAAVILPKEGQTVTLEQMYEWAAKNLSNYALPRQITILTEMPRFQIGKVLRRMVRDELLAAREAASGAATATAVPIVEHFPGKGEGRDGGQQEGGQEGKIGLHDSVTSR